ncbi:MAG: RluA family pseudouridine synthase [Flavobacteriales bacterium]|nr:RluA family pseudouridine synthase [Flavobacteriales bacterium]
MKEVEEEELNTPVEMDGETTYEHHKLIVDDNQVMMRIDKFLANQIANMTRNKVQKLAEQNFILVNDVAVKSSYKIKPKDVVLVTQDFPKRDKTLVPQDIPVTIVHEDDDLVIVNKEPGMVVHPSYGHYTGTLLNALKFHIDKLAQSDDDTRPGLVHRIDKNTSGILVVAKTEPALVYIQKQFFDRITSRRYRALVWGDFEEDEGTITGNIGRSLRNRKVMDVFPEGEEYGRHAVTHYTVLERFGYVTLVECRLETGRTHQIRAHFKHIGHPLFNDEVYGGDRVLRGTTFSKYKQFVQNCFKVMPRHALHAKSLGFHHPKDEQWVQFDSELPKDFSDVLDRWRNYTEQRLQKEGE